MTSDSLLAVCLEQLEWSPERLAREINKVLGAGTISAKAPYGWLKKSCPRGRLPQVIADLISHSLATHITPEQLWPRASFGARIDRFADDRLNTPWTSNGMRHYAATFVGAPGFERVRARRMVDAPALAHQATQWLIQPSGTLVARSSGEPITDQMIEALEARVGDLRRMDDTRGGNVVLDWAGHDLHWAAELLVRGEYDVETGRRLHRIVGELAQLAGWLACDTGQHALAHRHWLIGLRAAHAAGDDALGANIVSCLSYQATWLDQGTNAVRLMRIALTGARHLTSGRLRALLHSREGRALALSGDRSATEGALTAAQDSYEASDFAAEPSWTYWISPAVLAGDAGRAWLDLGDAQKAEASLSAGLHLFGDDQPRNRMLHTSSLAEARLLRAEVHGAAEAAHQALDLAITMKSHRATERFARLNTAFQHFDAVAAREVADRILTLVPKEPSRHDTR